MRSISPQWLSRRFDNIFSSVSTFSTVVLLFITLYHHVTWAVLIFLESIIGDIFLPIRMYSSVTHADMLFGSVGGYSLVIICRSHIGVLRLNVGQIYRQITIDQF